MITYICVYTFNMTIATIRQKLINYLQDAEDSKVKAVYILLEKDIQGDNIALSKEQLQTLDKERALYLSGEAKSYTKTEALQFIKHGK